MIAASSNAKTPIDPKLSQLTVNDDDEIEHDVPRQLNTFTMKVDEDIFVLNESMEGIVMKSGLCNHPDISSCNWNVCVKLQELRIGDKCMQNIQAFELKNMQQLEIVEIGSSCFTKMKGRMEVSQCEELRRVKIGKKSCAEWNEFVMRQCSVQEVEIGDGCFVDCQNAVFEGEDERLE